MTANEVKETRAKLGLTQDAMADMVGVTRNTVCRWEMGMHPVSTPIQRLLSALVAAQKRQTRMPRR